MNICTVGLSYGDEGKSKIADILSQECDIVVRHCGGNNAGHTVSIDGCIYKLHIPPCGILSGKTSVLAHGMVIDPLVLTHEIIELQNKGINIDIKISHAAHAILPWHISADLKKGKKIGTTCRGIGPCYAEKANRSNAIRMGNLHEALYGDIQHDFFLVDDHFHGQDLWNDYVRAAEFLKPFITDTGRFLRKAVAEKKNILFECAQGIRLDIDMGCFPFVTSSGTGPAAIPQACGLPNLHLDRIIGVVKAYSTRVGNGPFVSEIDAEAELMKGNFMAMGYPSECYKKHDEKIEIANYIREKGGEYGTTTGRPRRIGWLNIDELIESIELTGATELALMHSDTLAGMKKVCVYVGDKLEEVEPWKEASLGDEFFMKFVRMIEARTGKPITYISYGPDRKDTIFRKR